MPDFPAQGKGPLKLPRLSSLGPMSETSQEIGQLVFRGSNIEKFNANEFQDNKINGSEIRVEILDTYAAAARYNLLNAGSISKTITNSSTPFKLRQSIIDEFRIGNPDINKFNVDTGDKEVPLSALKNNGLIARSINEQVTGGLSKNIGAGFRFAGTGGTDIEKNAPLVLFLEKNRIPAQLIAVEYTDEFINENPALAGKADRGSWMLMTPVLTDDNELGDFSAQFAIGELRSSKREKYPDAGPVIKWFLNPLDNFFRLEPEQELMARTSNINLDQSLFAVCFYTGRKRLKNIYRNNIGVPDNVNREEQAIAVHNEISNRMAKNSDRLVTCVVSGRIRTEDKKLNRGIFEFLYDGNEFTYDYNNAIPFTNPTKF